MGIHYAIQSTGYDKATGELVSWRVTQGQPYFAFAPVIDAGSKPPA